MLPETTRPNVVPLRPDKGQLYEKAKEIESVFLSEMLAHSGLGESPDAFGGGMGEDQFASFLRNAQVQAIVESGGLGLAQTLFESLSKQEAARHEP